MRRLLLAAAFLVPAAVVVARINDAPQDKVVELDNYDLETSTSYINAAQCAGGNLNLKWSTKVTGAGGDTYRLFASSAPPPTSGDTANYCATADIPGSGGAPTVFADGFGPQPQWTADNQGVLAPGDDAAAAAGKTCTTEGDIVYICAHLLNGGAGGTPVGYASGKFVVQITAPAAPAGVRAWPADDDALFVEWNENTTGVEVDRYRVVVTPQGGTAIPKEVPAGTTEATISGLPVSTPCTVQVYAISLGGNPSQPTTVEATPGPVADFWEWYGGQEKGGCGSGGTGPLALVALGLLALLRRRA